MIRVHWQRHPLGAVLTAVVAACGDSGVFAPPTEPDGVYIVPHFVEGIKEDLCCPQIGDNGGHPNDWELEGTTADRYGGKWAAVESTVTVRVHSPLYQRLDVSFTVPDTVTRDMSPRDVFTTRW